MPDNAVHLLLVEDEAALREALAERLAELGYVVDQAETGEHALAQLTDFAYDVLVTDMRLPGLDGARLLEEARGRYPDIISIVITGYGTVKDAVEAIKRGASDFVTKPFQFDELRHALDSAMEQRRLRFENAYLRSQLEERYRFAGLVGQSRAMRELLQLLETVAATPSTILITGETGTGKEVVARSIHHNSPRKSHRFVAINCSAIPESLLEAELFGHVRGAFTGAVGSRQGRIEQAHRGTLFLDEVGTMSASLQMKLLRVLQEREFERVGDSSTVKVDVRVIAATNSDLARMVSEGGFREDLYYRLNVIPVRLPPLRERREDIPLLVNHFLQKFVAESERAGAEQARAGSGSGRPVTQRPPMTVSQQAMRRLMSYAWPGNVRQLENAIERAVALCGGRTQIEETDLPPELETSSDDPLAPDLSLPEEGIDLDRFVGNIELELIRRSLEKTRGNKGRAARLLHLKRTTLVEKLKRLERGSRPSSA
jgi:DNA-binding NtrC family response regulator